ncbi:MAG: hypothetical protein QOJ07_592, partial [Thermoleophilaceae bacterium]|nr:hypothetical protein [Thermoleophilaceae bacterium]
MTRAVAAAGVELAVDERGSGDAVVLIHDTAGSRTLWRETVSELGWDVRTIAYDRRGYGDSEAPVPYEGTTVAEQADDLAALIEALDAAPALLVGSGLGALVALDVMLHRRELTRGAVLIKPPLLWLSPHGPEVVGELRDAIEAGARDGGPGGAVDAWLTAVAGPGALASYGPERVESARASTRAFAADLSAGPSWGATRRELRSLARPVTIVTSRGGGAIWHEVAVQLGELLPHGRLVELEAGHLAPIEASGALADEIRALLA